MTLHNDVSRCTGVLNTGCQLEPPVLWVSTCPARDKCLRYTDKPRNAVVVSMMQPPRILKRGCEYLIEVKP